MTVNSQENELKQQEQQRQQQQSKMNINNSNKNKIIAKQKTATCPSLCAGPLRGRTLRRRERQRYIIGIEMRPSIYHTTLMSVLVL